MNQLFDARMRAPRKLFRLQPLTKPIKMLPKVINEWTQQRVFKSDILVFLSLVNNEFGWKTILVLGSKQTLVHSVLLCENVLSKLQLRRPKATSNIVSSLFGATIVPHLVQRRSKHHLCLHYQTTRRDDVSGHFKWTAQSSAEYTHTLMYYAFYIKTMERRYWEDSGNRANRYVYMFQVWFQSFENVLDNEKESFLL